MMDLIIDRRGSLQPSGRPIDDGHLGVPGHIWNRSPSGRRASLQPGMIPNLDVPQTTSRRSSLRYFPNTVLSICQNLLHELTIFQKRQ